MFFFFNEEIDAIKGNPTIIADDAAPTIGIGKPGDEFGMTAKLIVWTYDPETKQVQMMQSGYTKEVCAQLGVPLLIKNIPESLLPYIEPEDREKFSNAYKAMDQGSAYAEAEFRFKNPLQTSIQYERMVLKRIVNKASGKSFVYCCGQNITSFKAS